MEHQQPEKMNEADLLAGLLQGNESVYSYLYDNYSKMIYGIIYQVIKSESQVEYVMQDVFVKIWKNIQSFDAHKGRLSTWIIQITRNTAIDFLRSKQYKVNIKNQSLDNYVSKDMMDSTLHTSALNVVTLQPNIETIGLKDLLTKLDEDQKTILDLLYFKGYTQAEVSELLGMPLGTVKTKSRMALQQLRSIMTR